MIWYILAGDYNLRFGTELSGVSENFQIKNLLLQLISSAYLYINRHLKVTFNLKKLGILQGQQSPNMFSPCSKAFLGKNLSTIPTFPHYTIHSTTAPVPRTFLYSHPLTLTNFPILSKRKTKKEKLSSRDRLPKAREINRRALATATRLAAPTTRNYD